MNSKEHLGRRKRVRTRYIKEGLDNFEEHEVLELLLYYAIPGRDTNELAHKLLDKFHSLAALMETGVPEIVKNTNLSENTAILLNMIPHICRKYMSSKWKGRVKLNSVKKAGEFALSLYIGKVDEEVNVICLDNANCIKNVVKVDKGIVNQSRIYPRKIVEAAISSHSTGIILVHNHPAGTLRASAEDERTTRMLNEALLVLGIKLHDHIIVAGEEYLSMAGLGLID